MLLSQAAWEQTVAQLELYALLEESERAEEQGEWGADPDALRRRLGL